MILITGCTGYLGFHICEYLNDNKIPFFGIDNLSRSSKYNIFDKNKFLKIDISSKKIPKILAKKKIHSVIHAAAYSFPPESEDNKKIYYKNNILKTKIFINYCSNHKIEKFIFFSSSNVYKFNFRKISAVKENQKLKPSNYYGKTKLIIEKYLKKKIKNFYILRLFNVAGYMNRKNFYEYKGKYRRIFPVINEASRKKIPFNLNLLKSKNKIIFPARDFIHIRDFLEIISKIIKVKKPSKYILNVGYSKLVYLDKIIESFEKKLNKKVSFKKHISNKGNLNYTLCNNSQIKNKLKIKFKFNFEDIVKSCLKKKII